MDRSFYEGRLIVNIVGGIMRQDHLFPVHSKKLNWERIYRTADYHEVANIVYLGILGASEEMDPFWKEKFFESYRTAMRMNDTCSGEEAAVLGMLDRIAVQCVILGSSSIREFYEIPEAAGNTPLRLLFSEEDYPRAKGYLIDIGYEVDEHFKNHGEHMVNAAGFPLEIYRRIPMETELIQTNMRKLIDGAYRDPHFQGISGLSMEYGYIYRMTETVYLYCIDHLTIRYLLDTFQMYCAYRDDMDMDLVTDRLGRMRINEIADCLLQIAAMWFGAKNDPLLSGPKDDLSVYDYMENRILSNGLTGTVEKLGQASELREDIRHTAEKAQKQAEKLRRKEEKRMAGKAKIGFFSRFRKKQQQEEEIPELRKDGNVQSYVRSYGIAVQTPYFSFTLPYRWAEFGRVVVEPMDEDFGRTELSLDARDPDAYAVHLIFEPKEGDPLPVLDLLLYADPLNASVEVMRKEENHYIGRLTHMDDRYEYELHLVAVYSEGIAENEDLDLYNSLLAERDNIIRSLTPVNEPANKNVNLLERFSGWKTENMPAEYKQSSM